MVLSLSSAQVQADRLEKAESDRVSLSHLHSATLFLGTQGRTR